MMPAFIGWMFGRSSTSHTTHSASASDHETGSDRSHIYTGPSIEQGLKMDALYDSVENTGLVNNTVVKTECQEHYDIFAKCMRDNVGGDRKVCFDSYLKFDTCQEHNIVE
jgi:hypothetical protein